MDRNRSGAICGNSRGRAEVHVFIADDQNIAAGRHDVGVDVEIVVLRIGPVREQRHVASSGVADCLTDRQSV